MRDATIQRINNTSFIVSLASIIAGVIIGIAGVWGIIAHEDGAFGKRSAPSAWSSPARC